MRQEVSSPLYAAIDLGSNSFHMLIVRHIDGSIQTMAKIKRKNTSSCRTGLKQSFEPRGYAEGVGLSKSLC